MGSALRGSWPNDGGQARIVKTRRAPAQPGRIWPCALSSAADERCRPPATSRRPRCLSSALCGLLHRAVDQHADSRHATRQAGWRALCAARRVVALSPVWPGQPASGVRIASGVGDDVRHHRRAGDVVAGPARGADRTLGFRSGRCFGGQAHRPQGPSGMKAIPPAVEKVMRHGVANRLDHGHCSADVRSAVPKQTARLWPGRCHGGLDQRARLPRFNHLPTGPRQQGDGVGVGLGLGGDLHAVAPVG